MRARISFVQEMEVECLSCCNDEPSAQKAYDNDPLAYGIVCAVSLERSFWLVLSYNQHAEYKAKLKYIRDTLRR